MRCWHLIKMALLVSFMFKGRITAMNLSSSLNIYTKQSVTWLSAEEKIIKMLSERLTARKWAKPGNTNKNIITVWTVYVDMLSDHLGTSHTQLSEGLLVCLNVVLHCNISFTRCWQPKWVKLMAERLKYDTDVMVCWKTANVGFGWKQTNRGWCVPSKRLSHSN